MNNATFELETVDTYHRGSYTVAVYRECGQWVARFGSLEFPHPERKYAVAGAVLWLDTCRKPAVNNAQTLGWTLEYAARYADNT